MHTNNLTCVCMSVDVFLSMNYVKIIVPNVLQYVFEWLRGKSFYAKNAYIYIYDR